MHPAVLTQKYLHGLEFRLLFEPFFCIILLPATIKAFIKHNSDDHNDAPHRENRNDTLSLF